MPTPTALVVDGDANARQFLRNVLEQMGVITVSVCTSAEALGQLRCRPVDAMFTELGLADGSGWRLIAHAQQLHPGISTVISTGEATVEAVLEALRLGVCDYLIKPLSPQHVHFAVRRALMGIAVAAPLTSRRASLSESRALPQSATVTVPLEGDLRAIERRVVQEVILRCDGNKAAAARLLGMHRRTLYRVLDKQRQPDR